MSNPRHHGSGRLAAELAPFRDLWRGLDGELAQMGITTIIELRGISATRLADQYCAMTGRPQDPVLEPCFGALIFYAETGVVTPVWSALRARATLDRDLALARVARLSAPGSGTVGLARRATPASPV